MKQLLLLIVRHQLLIRKMRSWVTGILALKVSSKGVISAAVDSKKRGI